MVLVTVVGRESEWDMHLGRVRLALGCDMVFV